MTVTYPSMATPVVELRRYTVHPGMRDDLVKVFERHLVEPQEEAGMILGGTYLDEDDPDAFMWFRGFPSHAERVRALGAFYGGPVWAQHRDAANATMVDSDDVLLLRPTTPQHQSPAPVSRAGSDALPSLERVAVGVYEHNGTAEVDTWLATEVHGELQHALGVPVATWQTDPTPNGFPGLPVRQSHAFVWAATFADDAHREYALDRLHGSAAWSTETLPRLRGQTRVRRLYRLAPTGRSRHPSHSGR